MSSAVQHASCSISGDDVHCLSVVTLNLLHNGILHLSTTQASIRECANTALPHCAAWLVKGSMLLAQWVHNVLAAVKQGYALLARFSSACTAPCAGCGTGTQLALWATLGGQHQAMGFCCDQVVSCSLPSIRCCSRAARQRLRSIAQARWGADGYHGANT